MKINGPIPGKAFPGRASIIIKLLNLSNKDISAIYEKNKSLKINKYVPGTNIKIIQESKFLKKRKKTKVLINFAWHISKEIRQYLKKKLLYRGQVIDIISSKDFK